MPIRFCPQCRRYGMSYNWHLWGTGYRTSTGSTRHLILRQWADWSSHLITILQQRSLVISPVASLQHLIWDVIFNNYRKLMSWRTSGSTKQQHLVRGTWWSVAEGLLGVFFLVPWIWRSVRLLGVILFRRNRSETLATGKETEPELNNNSVVAWLLFPFIFWLRCVRICLSVILRHYEGHRSLE